MALKLNSSSGGSVTLQEPTTASNYTLTVPAQDGTVVATDASGTVNIDYLKTSFNRTWDNYPCITVYNTTTNGPQTEFRIHGYPGASGGDYSVNLRVDGKYISGVVSQANAVSNATAVTVATTTPTTIASISLTTTGKPVLLVATGDGNPNQSGGWHRAAIFRDGTQVSKHIISENVGGASANGPFSVCYIDSPSAGTYTYSLRAWQGSGSFTFGEEGDVQAPTIIGMEIL